MYFWKILKGTLAGTMCDVFLLDQHCVEAMLLLWMVLIWLITCYVYVAFWDNNSCCCFCFIKCFREMLILTELLIDIFLEINFIELIVAWACNHRQIFVLNKVSKWCFRKIIFLIEISTSIFLQELWNYVLKKSVLLGIF